MVFLAFMILFIVSSLLEYCLNKTYVPRSYYSVDIPSRVAIVLSMHTSFDLTGTIGATVDSIEETRPLLFETRIVLCPFPPSLQAATDGVPKETTLFMSAEVRVGINR